MDKPLCHSAPPVIEDAILVVKGLGFQYLWIDRYCIAQDSENEKHSQIQNMNMIYGHAEVTIIAAAGENPSYGLPGVNQRRRTSQSYAKVRGYTLVSTLSPPQREVESSRRATRAWTYQEEVLSR